MGLYSFGSMRFAVNWTVPDSTDATYCKAVQDAVIGYIKNGCPNDEFEGFKILERIHFPLKGGMQIVEAQSAAHVYKFTAPWTKNFGIVVEVLPSLSDNELVATEEALAASS
ncbi:MAG: DUF3303 domain-containing protein [Prochlorococcus sp.]